jgi:hypothetical protein
MHLRAASGIGGQKGDAAAIGGPARAAHADTGGVAMGKDPGIEVRGQVALVIDVALAGLIVSRARLRRPDDLVIGEDIALPISARTLMKKPSINFWRRRSMAKKWPCIGSI